jgi:large subunit ribosomal protein L21
MFAVLKSGGKQYKVQKDSKLLIEKIEGHVGDEVQLKEILMIGDGEKLNFGSPNISDAGVLAEVIKQTRGPKINIIYKRRRKNSRRKQGHKQDLTLVKIKEITSTGISKIKLKKGSFKKDEKKPIKAEAKPSTKIKSTSKKDVVAKKKTIIKKNKD